MLTKHLFRDIEGEPYLDRDVSTSFAHDILEHGPYLNETSTIGTVLYHAEPESPGVYVYREIAPLLKRVRTYPVPRIPIWCEDYFALYLCCFEQEEITFLNYVLYQGFSRAENIDNLYGYHRFAGTFALLEELAPAVALLTCNFSVHVDFSKCSVSLEF